MLLHIHVHKPVSGHMPPWRLETAVTEVALHMCTLHRGTYLHSHTHASNVCCTQKVPWTHAHIHTSLHCCMHTVHTYRVLQAHAIYTIYIYIYIYIHTCAYPCTHTHTPTGPHASSTYVGAEEQVDKPQSQTSVVSLEIRVQGKEGKADVFSC